MMADEEQSLAEELERVLASRATVVASQDAEAYLGANAKVGVFTVTNAPAILTALKDRSRSSVNAGVGQEGTEQHLCGYCGAQYLLMGADYLDQISEALDKVGAPTWSVDRSVMFSLVERIAALAPSALARPVSGEVGEGFSRDWCINMAQLEAGYEIGAGALDHPLRTEAALASQEGEVERYLGQDIPLIEPSDAEQAEWRPATCDYVQGLERAVNRTADQLLSLQAALTAEKERGERLVEELADARLSVVAFAGPWAVQYAKDFGLNDGELHPAHYDLLRAAGARMDDFSRAALSEGNAG
jgi:hypothetical protein